MSNLTFTPLADDKFAEALPAFVEVATVKPSGYLNYRGVVPVAALPEVTAALNTYFESQGRPAPVIYTRVPQTVEWNALDVPEVVIPDELPEDFK